MRISSQIIYAVNSFFVIHTRCGRRQRTVRGVVHHVDAGAHVVDQLAKVLVEGAAQLGLLMRLVVAFRRVDVDLGAAAAPCRIAAAVVAVHGLELFERQQVVGGRSTHDCWWRCRFG